jgi:hypothetical protein
MAPESISIEASEPPYSAWKCGGRWSFDGIQITMPKNRQISGILDPLVRGAIATHEEDAVRIDR